MGHFLIFIFILKNPDKQNKTKQVYKPLFLVWMKGIQFSCRSIWALAENCLLLDAMCDSVSHLYSRSCCHSSKISIMSFHPGVSDTLDIHPQKCYTQTLSFQWMHRSELCETTWQKGREQNQIRIWESFTRHWWNSCCSQSVHGLNGNRKARHIKLAAGKQDFSRK